MAVTVIVSKDYLNSFNKVVDLEDGSYSPSVLCSRDGRIYVFYLLPSGSNNDLKMVYSDDNGTNWSSPSTIVSDVQEGKISSVELQTGRIIVTYYKNNSPYLVYTDDRFSNTTEQEIIYA